MLTGKDIADVRAIGMNLANVLDIGVGCGFCKQIMDVDQFLTAWANQTGCPIIDRDIEHQQLRPLGNHAENLFAVVHAVLLDLLRSFH